MVQSSLTLKEGSKVKFKIIKWFGGYVFLYVGLTSQTSRSNNKQNLSPIKMVDPSLNLKEGPKVKFDIIKRFAGHVFLYIFLTCQNSRTNNKQILIPLQTVDSVSLWRSNLTLSKDSQDTICYMLTEHAEPLELIKKQILRPLKTVDPSLTLKDQGVKGQIWHQKIRRTNFLYVNWTSHNASIKPALH